MARQHQSIADTIFPEHTVMVQNGNEGGNSINPYHSVNNPQSKTSIVLPNLQNARQAYGRFRNRTHSHYVDPKAVNTAPRLQASPRRSSPQAQPRHNMSQAEVTNLAKYTQSQDKRSRLNRQFNYAFVGNASLAQSKAQSIHTNGGSGSLQDGGVFYGGGTAGQVRNRYRMVDGEDHLGSKHQRISTGPNFPNELKLISQLKNRQA